MLEFVLSVPKLARGSITLLNVTANQFGLQFVINRCCGRGWCWRSQRCGVDAFFDWCWAGAVRGDRYSLWVTSRCLQIRSLYANIWPRLPLYSTRGENTLASIKSPAIDRYRCSIKTCLCMCVFVFFSLAVYWRMVVDGCFQRHGSPSKSTASVCISHVLVFCWKCFWPLMCNEYVFLFAERHKHRSEGRRSR